MADRQKKGLERLTSPEQLDRLLVVIRFSGWIALLCLLVLTALIVTWTIVGKVSVTSSSLGIFFNPDAIILVQSELKGVVATIQVEQGSVVKQGDLLIVLTDSEKVFELKKTEEQIALLEEIVATEKRAALEKNTLQLTQHRAIYELQQKRARELPRSEEKGSEAFNLAVEMKKEEGLIQLLEQKVAHPDGEITQYGIKLLEMREQAALLKLQIEKFYVKAPADGTVLLIEVTQGEEVDFGKTLLWFEKKDLSDSGVMVYGFFPLEKHDPIKPGMHALVQFNSVNSAIYGKMIGQVVSVQPFATTTKGGILYKIPSEELRSYLTQNLASTLIVVAPQLDPKTNSGFAWTTRNGPPNAPPFGSVAQVEVTIQEKRPIQYLIPSGGK